MMGASLSVVGGLVARILLSLGVSFLVLQGFSELLVLVGEQISATLNGLGSNVANTLGLCNADLLINAWLSAHSAVLAMSQLKKFSWK